MKENEIYIKRCFDLAKRGWGMVSPNPMVGAVLVHKEIIIGEGWHQIYGGPHAEVNAINSVPKDQQHLIKDSTLYISLEPCNFYGKTPPCTELILKNNIKNVVISTLDHTAEVSGKSLDFLRSQGIIVITGVLEKEGNEIAKYRNTVVDYKRPFIQIKYAVSADGYIGIKENQISLSSELSNRFVHKMRSRVDAILIGKHTALIDNPFLNTRLWPGKSPIKVLIDPKLEVPMDSNLFKGSSKVYIFNLIEDGVLDNINKVRIDNRDKFLKSLLYKLYELGIGILLVEGGSATIQHFIDKDLFDEIIIINTPKILKNGIQQPEINVALNSILKLDKDNINSYSNLKDNKR